MKLKKQFTLLSRKTQSYSLIYDDPKELTLGIANLCNTLNKSLLVAQVFSHDEKMNELLQDNCQQVLCDKNWKYYLVKDISFITDINLESQRFLCIYSIEKFHENFGELRKELNNNNFEIVLENYLELTELKINAKKYSNEEIAMLLNSL